VDLNWDVMVMKMWLNSPDMSFHNLKHRVLRFKYGETLNAGFTQLDLILAQTVYLD
jgi:hypothetical protein